MGERGLIIHGTTLYHEMTSIPMILRIPGRSPQVVEQPAMLVDLAPTLLAALGLQPDPRMQGIDLHSAAVERPRIISSEVDLLARKFSVRDPEGFKVIFGPADEQLAFPNPKTWELYALHDDPREQQDLSESHAEDRERLAKLLEAYRDSLAALSQELGAAGSGSLGEETVGMLKQLGYL